MTNPKIFDKVLSNTWGHATSVLVAIPTLTPLCAPAKAWNCIYSTISYFWFCMIICSSFTSYLLILYGGGVDDGN